MASKTVFLLTFLSFVAISVQQVIEFDGVVKYAPFNYAYTTYKAINITSDNGLEAAVNEMDHSMKWYEVESIIVETSMLEKLPTEIFERSSNLLMFSAENVQLKRITREDFRVARKLTHLLLKDNLISELENGFLAYMERLLILDLSHNLITTIARGTFVGCSDDLFEVNLSFNKIKNLDFNAFRPLGHPERRIVNLNLESNEISSVENTYRSLEFGRLYLSNNYLRSFTCSWLKITELRLSNNKLESVSTALCTIKHLNLLENPLKFLCIDGDVIVLKCSNSLLNDIEVYNYNEPRMVLLELTNNDGMKILPLSIKLMELMMFLDLTNTTVTINENSFALMSALQNLYLRNTSLESIPRTAFANNENLKALDLSNNKLITIDVQKLAGLSNLVALDLSNNKLDDLIGFEKIFRILPKLNEIRIAGNSWKLVNCTAMMRSFSQRGIKISQKRLQNMTEFLPPQELSAPEITIVPTFRRGK